MSSASWLLARGLRCAPPSRLSFSPTQHAPRIWKPAFRQHQSYSTLRSLKPPRRSKANRVLLFASANGAVLGTATFVSLSDPESADEDRTHTGSRHTGSRDGDADETSETRMLHASRDEIAKSKDKDKSNPFLMRLRHNLVYYLDVYCLEPLLTGLRFLHLVIIFAPVLLTTPATYLGPRQASRDRERSGTLWWYAFLVSAMERAGPAFIKLGQWSASRSDIFPTELCDRMSKLHANAPAHSLAETRHTVEAAFDGRSFEAIFDEFDAVPLGVGAIAQVYKAKLKADLAAPLVSDAEKADTSTTLRSVLTTASTTTGLPTPSIYKSPPKTVPSSYVAIKVLHPWVERTVRRDLRIMGFFASLLNQIPTVEWLSLPDEVAQFGEMMNLQLDLRIEAANLARFRANFKNRTTATFPFPYLDFTTRSVLVEEFAEGIPLAKFIEHGAGDFRKHIASEGLDAFLRMLLLDNFVHADLHPGNIMVRFSGPRGEDATAMVVERLKPFLVDRHQQHQRQEKREHHHYDASDSDPHDEAGRSNNKFFDTEAWQQALSQIDTQGYRPQLLFLDVGLVTELNATNRRNFLDLFKAIAEFDGHRAGQLMCTRCRQPDAVLAPDIFALKMQHLVLAVKSKTLALANVKIGDILQTVLAMVRQHHVRLEGDFVNVVISILLLEGIGRSLDPETDLLSSSLPVLREVGARGGKELVRGGDWGVLVFWAGLEARRFVRGSFEDVERCVKYDLLAPNV